MNCTVQPTSVLPVLIYTVMDCILFWDNGNLQCKATTCHLATVESTYYLFMQ